MRIAVLIIGLIFGFIMFLQAIVGGAAGSLGDNEELAGAAAIAVVASFMWVLASALVIALPMASVVIFLVAALFLIPTGATTDFKDLILWGGFSIFLALMSWFGWRGKRNEKREKDAERRRQVDRDSRMEALLSQRSDKTRGCRIEARKVEPGSRSNIWRFAAVEPNGRVVATSESFKSGRSLAEHKTEEWSALEHFVKTLEVEGWHLTYRPAQEKNPDWFQYQLAQ